MRKRKFVDLDSSPYQISWMLPALFYFAALGLAIAALTKVVGLGMTVAELRALVNGQTDVDAGIFSPSKTLFVAKGWKAGYEPPTHFTDISSALTASLDLGPTSDNPLQIIIYTGTYVENVTLVSNVYVTGLGEDTFIEGTVSWFAGIGVNAIADEDFETVILTSLKMTFLTVNTTGKPNFGMRRAIFKTIECTMMGSAGIYLRSNDISRTTDAIYDNTVLYSGGSSFATDGVFFSSITATNTVNLALFGINAASSITVDTDSSSVLTIKQTFVSGTVFMGNTTLLICSESELDGELTVDSTAQANILSCDYNVLLGMGQIDRRIWMTRTTSTVFGANIVNLNPPYISVIYKIYFTQISGPFANPPILLLTKDNGFFDYNSSADGLLYDVLVVLQP